MEKIIEILLENRNVGSNSKCRHTIIAYGYKGKQLIHALNSYTDCCKTSKFAGHYFDHAETKLLNVFIPDTIYVVGITQGKKLLETTIPCSKCMKVIQEKGVKKIKCFLNGKLITIKL
jgi:deoxycytidylate deaminase